MTSIFDIRFSELGLLEAVLAATMLFLGLRLLRRLLATVFAGGPHRVRFQRAFPIAESFVWFLFTVWSLRLVFGDPFFQSLALLILLAVAAMWLSWFAAKDFTAGLILRFQDAYEVDQQIRLGDVSGTISSIGYLGLDVERESGEVVKIPYSKIAGKLHAKRPPAELTNHYRFKMEVPKRFPVSETTRILRTSVLMSPWASLNKEPLIRRLAETEDAYIFEVGVHAIGTDHFQAIEKDVKDQLGG